MLITWSEATAWSQFLPYVCVSCFQSKLVVYKLSLAQDLQAMLVPSLRLLAFTVSLSLVFGAPAKDCAYKVKESIPPPRGWVKLKPAPPDHNIELRIGLPQPNFHVLEQHLYEVSDPYHERYGAHLSKVEVEELVAPHPESLALVDEWLASHGIQESVLVRSPAKDWVIINVPVNLAEKMLDTVSLLPLLFRNI